MDKYAKEFVDYLFYIGMITTETIPVFISSLQKNIEDINEIGMQEIIIKSVIGYLANLTAGLHQSIAVNIVSKFSENKLRVNSDVLMKLISFYSIKQQLSLRDSLIKWNTRAVTASAPLKYSPNDIIANYNDISKSNNSNSLSMDKQFKCYRKNTKSSRKNNSQANINRFIQRQEDFIESKSKKKDRIFKHNEDEYKAVCTFSPNLSLTNSNNLSEGNKSAYLRLYEDSSRRRIDYDKKVNAFVQQMKVKSNHNKPPKCTIDKSKIEQLYNDYKVRQKKRVTLISQIDNETGVTFKPQITSSPLYKKVINTNIHERTKKTIENKKNFIDLYTFIHEQEMKQPDLNRIGRKSSKKVI